MLQADIKIKFKDGRDLCKVPDLEGFSNWPPSDTGAFFFAEAINAAKHWTAGTEQTWQRWHQRLTSLISSYNQKATQKAHLRYKITALEGYWEEVQLSSPN